MIDEQTKFKSIVKQLRGGLRDGTVTLPDDSAKSLVLRNTSKESSRSINVVLVAVISAVIHVCLGVLLSPLFAFAFLGTDIGRKLPHPQLWSFLFPIGYGVLGFIVGGIAALLFNRFAGSEFKEFSVDILDVAGISLDREIRSKGLS